jgi:hypothetical protein
MKFEWDINSSGFNPPEIQMSLFSRVPPNVQEESSVEEEAQGEGGQTLCKNEHSFKDGKR